MTESVNAGNWDREYEQGRYEGEPPIPFVDTIIESLGKEGKDQYGLYVGCGNGRNYLPLRDAGLKLHGMDISSTAISQLKRLAPETEQTAFVGDFANYNGGNIFAYIVAIQVFQHGNREEIDQLFAQTHDALKDEGKLFLRVNSIDTDLGYDREITERKQQNAGRTVRYKEGPKAGQEIHFYTENELASIAIRHSFEVIQPPQEITEARKPPLKGSWSQWETIWQKKAKE